MEPNVAIFLGLAVLLGLMIILARMSSKERSTVYETRQRAIQEKRRRAIQVADVDNMDGFTFEHYVAWLLRQKGYEDVEVTSGSGDFGADIIARRAGEKYAIQVKRWASNVSRRAISDAVASKDYYGCTSAMVVTNSYFSKNAIVFARSANCELVDRDLLTTWIMDVVGSPEGTEVFRQVPDFQPGIIVNADQLDSTVVLKSPGFSPEELDQNSYRLFVEDEEGVAQSGIREYAARSFPDDFSMQLYIIESETAAHSALVSYGHGDLSSDEYYAVRRELALKWPGQYSMQLYELQENIKAYRKLISFQASGIDGTVIEKAKEIARLQWPSDFTMQLYELRNQIRAYRRIHRN